MAYRDFLANPQPASQWIGSKGLPRFAPLWRPFAGPLKASSQKQSLVILHGLFEWLISTGCTTNNPFAGVRIQDVSRKVAASTVAADTTELERDRAKRNRVLAHGLPGELEDVPPGTYLIRKVDDLFLKLPSAGRMEVVDANSTVETGWRRQ